MSNDDIRIQIEEYDIGMANAKAQWDEATLFLKDVKENSARLAAQYYLGQTELSKINDAYKTQQTAVLQASIAKLGYQALADARNKLVASITEAGN